MTTIPKGVVRFYGNIQYALESIGFKQITLLHPDKLNDPFDPYFFFETDFDDRYSDLVDYVQRHHSKDLQVFTERFPKGNWKQFLVEIEDLFRSFRKNVFLFSSSAIEEINHPKNNLYLWSHYGNGHRGAAIEFNTTSLTGAILAKAAKLGIKEVDQNDVWWEIKYSLEPPKITAKAIFQSVMNANENPDEKAWLETELGKTINLRSRSKNIRWQIENEWRLVWHNDKTSLKIQKLDLLDDAIAAVYLGCLIDSYAKETLISETKNNFPNARVFVGKQAKGAFALEFEQLS